MKLSCNWVKSPSSPLNLRAFWRILATEFGMKLPSRVFVGAFMGSHNQPGFSLTLLNLTHVAKSASSVDHVISLIDAPHASASWPADTIIGSTPEALRKWTLEEKSIDVPGVTAEVVAGGLKFTVRRGAMFYIILHSFYIHNFLLLHGQLSLFLLNIQFGSPSKAPIPVMASPKPGNFISRPRVHWSIKNWMTTWYQRAAMTGSPHNIIHLKQSVMNAKK